ncbi:tetratricopeptide repeat protein [Arthrobacter yangruifuii]|uniref:Tetratricopeptide repeat protein n=1 Tax=Arthrobacter yangruifuii TaxID=2606616 RepID=A0A5N6MT13_9MICC|nr:CDP-glycerol glycerophosphotransferase family protein [Arthrobacter yangruifuii]KAD4007149.1 tetratricopeptide repeat protein [Arthrobacter yangruifuii]
MLGWQAAYAKARSDEKKGKWDSAIQIYSSLIRHGEDENPRVVFRLGHALFRRDRLEEAAQYLERAVSLEPGNANWHYRLGFVLERQKSYASAILHYDAALEIDPTQTKWQDRKLKCAAHIDNQQRAVRTSELNDVMGSNGPDWERLDLLEAGYDVHQSDKNWLKSLAAARFRMLRYEGAAELYTEVVELDPLDAESHFMRGWAWQKCGRTVIADKCFARASELDTRHDAKSFGVGGFYQSRGQWRLAAEAYVSELRVQPENPELNFRAGMALQKIYAWKESERYLARAVVLNPAVPQWHYRRGLSFERLGEMHQAAASYAEAASRSNGKNPYWSYRLGEVRAAMGDYEGACDAYRESYTPPKASDLDQMSDAGNARNDYDENLLHQTLLEALSSQSGSLCYILGRKAEALGKLTVAEDAYRAALARLEEHSSEVHYRLGRVLDGQHKWREGAEVYSNVRIFKRPFGVDVAPYLKSASSKKSMTYLEYAETVRIEDRVVLYESSHGVSVSCNPLAIYRQLIADPRFEGFTHVWVLNEKRRIPAEMRDRPDVIFISRESDLYLRYIASAKYLINNNTFPPYFVRRVGQYYLNTWHGTPIKTLGRDIKSGVMDHKNAARNFLQATHMVFPNKFTADCQMDKYDVANLYAGELALTGYPRNDVLAVPDIVANEGLRERLGIPFDKKVVLYAPTWRGTLASKNLDETRLAEDLDSFSSDEWHFLYRGHSVNDGSISGSYTDLYSVPGDIDTNDLLAIVDVLVTDYSSIMFDFMATHKPIVYYAYDLEQYQSERGLYFDLNDMGGFLCEDVDSALSAIRSAVLGVSARSVSAPFVQELVRLEQGQSARRAVEFFFFGSTEFKLAASGDGRANALFYAGSFIPNGVTASYLNLVSQLPDDKWNFHTVVDPVAVASEPGRQAKFNANPAHIRAIGRVGTHLVTPEERWVIDKFNTQHDLDSEELWDIYHRAHRREFVRIFGHAEFDAIICFEGYARFWASLLGAPYIAPKVSSIYLHSVMGQEWKQRFPYLEGVFRIYDRYDQLLSVSESASEVNERDLVRRFDLHTKTFKYVNNLLNPTEVIHAAADPLDEDIERWMHPDYKTFVSVGRLSPEKGHLKLLEAFAVVVRKCPEARLIIVGDGPMKTRIVDAIERLAISDNVLMAGMRTNPYPIVDRGDFFVFASEYEGQGIAVLEALILGKPVISTDVVGPKSILKGDYGLLVENTRDGLARGMIQFIENNPVYRAFDYETYLKEGIGKFTRLALGELER